MRILALVHRVPYPPNKGEKIRAYHELAHLASRGHVIDLATFADVEEDLAWAPQLREICRNVEIVPKDRVAGRVQSVLALPAGAPLSVGYFRSRRFASVVRRWLATHAYHVVFCYSSPMAELVRGVERSSSGARLVRVMDFVDVDSDKWRQYAERVKPPMKQVYLLEASLLARYEREVAERFDASALVSEDEVKVFRRVAPRAREVVAIPNGVDVSFFGATARRETEAPVFVFVGQMDYFANVDAVVWFAKDILPIIHAEMPEARFRIVGRAPTAEVKKLAELRGVEVTGGVPDVRAFLGGATVAVAPLRIARGIQNKVLEAMAARVPIVASPAAREGIEATDGVHLVVRGDARPFAEAVMALARDPARRAALAENARGLVEARYAWAPAMEKLERLMASKVGALSGGSG